MSEMDNSIDAIISYMNDAILAQRIRPSTISPDGGYQEGYVYCHVAGKIYRCTTEEYGKDLQPHWEFCPATLGGHPEKV